MAWGDPQSYWWLQPQPPQDMLPAMQFGARLQQQAVANALNEKQLQLQTQRTGIELQEFFSKQELQNKILAGNMKLAKSMSGITNWADPSVLTNLWKVAEEQPELMGTPQWNGALKLHENAVIAREKLKEYEAARLARAGSLDRRLDILEQHYGKQDEIARLRLEIAEAKQESDSALAQRKTDLLEGKLRAYEQSIEVQQGNLELRRERAVMDRRRLEAKLPEADRIKLQHELNVLREQLDNFDITPAEYYKKRDEVYGKYTPKTAAPLAAPDASNPLGLDLKLKTTP